MTCKAKVMFVAVLLAFAGTASAVTYDIQDGDILAIGNLELNFDNDEKDGFYNITFVTSTVFQEYGTPDPTFDFLLAEDGVAAWPQIIEAINAAPEPVTGASDTGSNTWFIPFIDIKGLDIPLSVAVGSALTSQGWAICQSDCLLGVTPLDNEGLETFARVESSVIPVPAAVWLFGSGLLGLVGVARRKQATSV